MPQKTLTSDQKAMLIGFLNREKDYMLSVVSMAEKIHIPHVTGTMTCARRDLEFVSHLRAKLRGPEPTVEFSDPEIETLLDLAENNDYKNREEFWKSITLALR